MQRRPFIFNFLNVTYETGRDRSNTVLESQTQAEGDSLGTQTRKYLMRFKRFETE